MVNFWFVIHNQHRPCPSLVVGVGRQGCVIIGKNYVVSIVYRRTMSLIRSISRSPHIWVVLEDGGDHGGTGV